MIKANDSFIIIIIANAVPGKLSVTVSAHSSHAAIKDLSPVQLKQIIFSFYISYF